MWTCLDSIKLIRYLFVWRINNPLVRLPGCPPLAFSSVLGRMIAERLPTRDANLWRKALGQPSEGDRSTLPSPGRVKADPTRLWPIESVLFIYPGKVSYGKGELILWELKLFGESADHGFFLEVILPAMEEASYTSDDRWHRQNSLWGRFDIQDVYVARGAHWEPLVSDGRLDFRYRPNSGQWADGLTLNPDTERTFNRLFWITPVDFTDEGAAQNRPANAVPTLGAIIQALNARLGLLMGNRHRSHKDIREGLSAEESLHLQNALEVADRAVLRATNLERIPNHWPGRWIGSLRFYSIPPPIIPFLQLASILHIGNQTHFGCGTFSLA